MKNNNKYESTYHSVCLRNLGTLFQGVKNRVLRELLKKRSEMDREKKRC